MISDDRMKFWKGYLARLSELCRIQVRGMRRADLFGLLEVLYARSENSPEKSLTRRLKALYSLWVEKWAFFCVDCGVDTGAIDEYYIVNDRVWYQAWPDYTQNGYPGDGMLCIGCLERRLGRTLASGDFEHLPINNELHGSSRLRDRLTRILGGETIHC